MRVDEWSLRPAVFDLPVLLAITAHIEHQDPAGALPMTGGNFGLRSHHVTASTSFLASKTWTSKSR